MSSSASGIAPRTVEAGPAVHDFDFLFGTWRVRHRRLVERLVGSDEWQAFEGTCTAWPILGGAGNIDDNVLELPAGTYRAISLRTYDPAANAWSIWWLDGRSPRASIPRLSAGSRTESGRSSPRTRSTGVRSSCDSCGRSGAATRSAGSRRSRPTTAPRGR